MSLAAAQAEIAASEVLLGQMGDVLTWAAAPIRVKRTSTQRIRASVAAHTPTREPAPVARKGSLTLTLSAYRSLVAKRMVAYAPVAGLDRKTVVRTHWSAGYVVTQHAAGVPANRVAERLVFG